MNTKDETIKNLVAALRLAITWLELCEHDPRLSSAERGILVTDLVEIRGALKEVSEQPACYSERVARSLDETCKNCANWEMHEAKKEGYCHVFRKTTLPTHGRLCTAWKFTTNT